MPPRPSRMLLSDPASFFGAQGAAPVVGSPPTARPRENFVSYNRVDQNHYFGADPALPARHYYLELVRGSVDNVIDSIELPYVSHIEVDQPLAVTRTYTMGGLYEEHSGFVERTFSLRGRSGKSRLDLAIFQKFRNFLEKYAKLSAENKNAFIRGEDINLVLNFPWDGESFYCTVIVFKPSSDIGVSRCSFEYSLVLKTNGFASRKWSLPQNIHEFLESPGNDGDHTKWGHNCFRRSLKTLSGKPLRSEDSLDIDAPPPDADYIYGKAPQIYEQVEVLGLATSGLRTGGRSAYQSLYDLGTLGLESSLAHWDDADEDTRNNERLSRRLTTVLGWYVWLILQAKEGLGFRSQHLTTDPNPGFPVLDLVTPIPPRDGREPLTVDTVQASDTTAFDIALRVLGDRNQWIRIVRANDMRDARTKRDGRPLVFGDRILVPSVTGVPKGQAADIYGTDIRMGLDGDFVAAGTTDIAVISGIDNVDQNLTHRYKTVKGTNKAFPEFGLPPIIGTVATSDLAGQVMSAVKQQTVRDHRVSGISKMAVSRAGGTVTVDVGVEVVANAIVPKGFQYPGL